MNNFATVQDIIDLWRPLNESETARATALLPIVCDRLRIAADNTGRDLDLMLYGDGTAEHPANLKLQSVAKSVTVDIIARTLMTPDGAPLSQFSESALGYSQSGTFLNPGGGIFIKRSELEALGLSRQRYGVIDLYGG